MLAYESDVKIAGDVSSSAAVSTPDEFLCGSLPDLSSLDLTALHYIPFVCWLYRPPISLVTTVLTF